MSVSSAGAVFKLSDENVVFCDFNIPALFIDEVEELSALPGSREVLEENFSEFVQFLLRVKSINLELMLLDLRMIRDVVELFIGDLICKGDISELIG